MLFLFCCGSRKLIPHHIHYLHVRAVLNIDLKPEDSVGSVKLHSWGAGPIGASVNAADDRKLVHFYFISEVFALLIVNRREEQIEMDK